ncbi:MAG TPA: UDP-N-acetylmuramoyl-tripeptide--D-alanyl-D-alanine ligase [Gemmatimonadaceae bacterium]
MTASWTADRVTHALGSQLVGDRPQGGGAFTGVSTDTRHIPPGALFVALAGERFDAHDFLADAVTQGAAGLVVSKPDRAANLGVPVFTVADTLVALGALGRERRRAWGGRVVAVVGTNGKTSTKELLRAAIGSRFRVHATEGNFNNLVGVPLTLLAIPDEAEVAVIEMGTNHPGEIPRLRAIVEPDLTVVTSIAEEHLEGLGDLEGVLREELAGCEGVPVCVVPASQPDVVHAAQSRARRTVAAGLDQGDLHPTSWSIAPDGLGCLVVEGVEVRPPVRGVHNLRNATLALAVARELSIPVADAARGIAAMRIPPMRVNYEAFGGLTLINDAYNANPGSTRAALELLEAAGEGRPRLAVLGSMLEMGDHAERLHREVAEEAVAGPFDLVLGVGMMGPAVEAAAQGSPRGRSVPDADAAWPLLEAALRPDAVVLLKGSRGVRLERLVPHLADWARAHAGYRGAAPEPQSH